MSDTRVADLDRKAVRRLARSAGVVGSDAAEEGFFVTGPVARVRALRQVVRAALIEGERNDQLLDLLLENVEPAVMGPERLLQLRMQAEARRAFLQEVPLLDSAGVGDVLGSTARNRASMANRLKREGKLLAVAHRGVDLYPVEQIIDGVPSPAIPAIREAFSKDTPWSLALWMNAPSPWLGGEKPRKVLASDPDRVVEAARRATDIDRF